ncbi:MAG: UDP-N-acetylglucosamine 2-epimerase (non-hydrolyzing) [Candidatus Paceibacterota bacterium]
MSKKILSIVGARPQFIKLSALSKKINDHFNEVIVHTGQHYDENMSEVFFQELGISKPQYNLNIGSGYHGVQTGEMMKKLEEVLEKELPDLVIIFGDTNSTLAGALVASKMGIKIVHVEAGLRSFNRAMPEEINRVVADHVSDYLYAPNNVALNNLTKEGLAEKANVTGDIMVDSVTENAKKATERNGILDRLKVEDRKYYLATLHRPYNVDDPENLKLILKEFSHLTHPVIFPIHPRTRKVINENIIKVPDSVILIEPLGYIDFICLQQHSHKIITDSGGIQKEAYILKKPCITLRSETEWVETVISGWNLLINISESSNFSSLIESFCPPNRHEPLFGENVAEKMVTHIKQIL